LYYCISRLSFQVIVGGKTSHFHTTPEKSTLLKMKEAIVEGGPKVTIHDTDILKPNVDQVLIKVVFSGSNPKDCPQL